MGEQQKWTLRWNSWISPTKVPGVFKRKEGGFLVRGRTKDPATGKDREVRKALDVETEADALKWLTDELERVRNGASAGLSPRMRFGDYALSLAERKLVAKEIKSARGRERWKYTLEHLIGGTDDVTGFGELFIDEIRPVHVEAWRTGIARLIGAGTYAPTTANGWLNILRHILKRAKRELQLPFNAAEGIPAFDTSEHEVYTEEEPNALNAEETAAFLACMKESFPAQYAMAFLGFATGLRPSSMRPLRRQGPTPDVLWDEGVILIRRSHTLGDEFMKTTKTGLRQRITVPAGVMEVLKWHVATQLATPEQQASELLFPAEDGSFRSEAFLKKAFPIVGQLIGLKKRFTPRGMRRTFNDLARVANVEALVTRSISGHLTEQMREHYSTVSPVEQRESIGRVLRLVQASEGSAPAGTGDGGMHRGMQGASGGMHSRLGVR